MDTQYSEMAKTASIMRETLKLHLEKTNNIAQQTTKLKSDALSASEIEVAQLQQKAQIKQIVKVIKDTPAKKATWKCSCARINTGNFCSACGSQNTYKVKLKELSEKKIKLGHTNL